MKFPGLFIIKGEISRISEITNAVDGTSYKVTGLYILDVRQ